MYRRRVDLLNTPRLREHASGHGPSLFAGMAREWVASVPGALARIRTAAPDELPGALHELRSGAVAVGLTALPAALAAVEQGAEAGEAVSSQELDALALLAERSCRALEEWWRDSGGV